MGKKTYLKMLRKFYIFICIGLLLFTFCVSSKFILTGNVYPEYNGTVKIFNSLLPYSIKYEEIGWISGIGANYKQWTDLLEKMQKDVAKHGANAIVIINTEKDKNAFVTYNPQFGLIGGSISKKNLLVIAIRIIK